MYKEGLGQRTLLYFNAAFVQYVTLEKSTNWLKRNLFRKLVGLICIVAGDINLP